MCLRDSSSTGETLLLECGVRMDVIKKALDWNLDGVAGCLVSHRHRDHCRALPDMLSCGIRVLAPGDVFDSFTLRNRVFCKTLEPLKGYSIGSFKVFTIPLCHTDTDGGICVCYGYTVQHDEMGLLLFVTDAVSLDYNIPGLNHILIEANYADEILTENIEGGRIHSSERNRLLQSHMELGTTKRILKGLELSNASEVVLLHLSSRNADYGQFINEIRSATGKPAYIAQPGLNLDISLTPY